MMLGMNLTITLVVIVCALAIYLGLFASKKSRATAPAKKEAL